MRSGSSPMRDAGTCPEAGVVTTSHRPTPGTGPRTGRPSARTLGRVLGAWSGGFAVVHLAWALGWRGGVPEEVAPISERPFFLAYDVVAALLMLAAAGVALRLARGGVTRTARRRLRLLTLVGALAALARGVPALLLDVVSGPGSAVGLVADTWFVVAGLLGLALWRGAGTGRG